MADRRYSKAKSKTVWQIESMANGRYDEVDSTVDKRYSIAR